MSGKIYLICMLISAIIGLLLGIYYSYKESKLEESKSEKENGLDNITEEYLKICLKYLEDAYFLEHNHPLDVSYLEEKRRLRDKFSSLLFDTVNNIDCDKFTRKINQK